MKELQPFGNSGMNMDHVRLYEVLTLLLTAASDLAVERQNN